jgi:hypothetical protein
VQTPECPICGLVVEDGAKPRPALESRVPGRLTSALATKESSKGLVESAQRSADWLVAKAHDVGALPAQVGDLAEYPGPPTGFESGVVDLAGEGNQLL